MIILYSYYRSSASYRVRIALNYKGLAYHLKPVHLVNHGGEQWQQDYMAKNPQALLPTLVDNDVTLTQSLAILEYLEEAYPETAALLPQQPEQRAKVRALAQLIACEVHPVNNLRILKYLTAELGVSDTAKNTWYQHWITLGFSALEKHLTKTAGQYCFGDSLSIADVCLIPQVYNAKRFACDLKAFPLINKINDHCLTLDAFLSASPEHQEDAPHS